MPDFLRLSAVGGKDSLLPTGANPRRASHLISWPAKKRFEDWLSSDTSTLEDMPDMEAQAEALVEGDFPKARLPCALAATHVARRCVRHGSPG